MRHVVTTALALILLAGCQEESNSASTGETSPGGIAYTRLYIPDSEDVAIQIAWPSNWAMRPGVNQDAPFIGAELIMAGGAEGFPAGEVIETFADLNAEGTLWASPDHFHGQLIAPKEHLDKAVEIAAAHLSKPTLDQAWFERIRQGIASRLAETRAQPATQGYDALRWAVLGDTPLRLALTGDAQLTEGLTNEEVRRWHAEVLTRTGASVVIAGDISAEEAAVSVDALLQGLPDHRSVIAPAAEVDFSPRRVLLHVPEAQTSTLIFLGPLPPTRKGKEFEDVLIATALGGDDNSVLFDAVRTGLRASYGFGAGIDAYTREHRILVFSGEVETSKLAEAEVIVRSAYSEFLKSADMSRVIARKPALEEHAKQTAKDPVTASFSALMALLDGQDPNLALTLPEVLAAVTEETLRVRAASAFPAADQMIVMAVSPDAEALPGACVISTPSEAANCR